MSVAPGRPLASRFFVAAIVVSVIAAVLLALSFARWREIGWGGRAWLVAFIVMIVIRAPFTFRHLANTVVTAHGGRVDLTLLAAMAVSGVALPLLFLGGADLTFANYKSPVWIVALGAVIAIPALWLHWRAHTDLGRNWSPSLEPRWPQPGDEWSVSLHPSSDVCGLVAMVNRATASVAQLDRRRAYRTGVCGVVFRSRAARGAHAA